ncbi:MAG TPA: tandem-95 repeat protein [Epsilonproteobacteria bacterium]|nr:tandem-95 repeat protein [Campylobacterota bacterium]
MKHLLLILPLLLLLTACGGDNGKGKQNSNHGLINNPPVAKEQHLTLKEDTQHTIILAATDPDKDTIGYRVSKEPSHGKLTGEAPNLTYTPNKDYNGEDTFTFIANDGVADSKETSIELNIEAVNDVPVANKDTFTIDEDSNITIDVLSNDSDVDINETLKIIHIFKPSNGIATLKSNQIHYIPNPNFNGEEHFNYKITDKAGATAVATVTVQVKPVNDAPLAKEDTSVTTINTPMTINVLNNDTDIDSNDKLTLSHITDSKNAEVSIEENKISYTPNKDYTGEETLTYTIKDSQGATSKAEVSVTVRALNDEEKYAQLENSGVIPKLDRSNTLGGTDSDKNGIRDDVDDYINSTYTDPKEKAAAQQMAKVFQKILVKDIETKEVAKKIFEEMFKGIRCANKKNINHNELEAITYNTTNRVKKYFKFNNLLDGSVTSLPRGDTCEN